MENFSKISQTLPKPEDPLIDINKDLSNQFKSAANSLTSLYKASIQKNQLIFNKGYLQCLDDVIEMLASKPQELDDFLILKKLQLEKAIQNSRQASDTESTPSEFVKIPSEYEFNISTKDSPTPSQLKFPPTNPILSVDRKQGKNQHQYQQHSNSSPVKSQMPIQQSPESHLDATTFSWSNDSKHENQIKSLNGDIEEDTLLENSKRKLDGPNSSLDKRPKF